ncbi:MAG: alpha/beta hydrolase [Verrucomicrobia bacterium]|nr:alpha/beta hydrolase [Verrucomicrobiota bacterium]
MRKLVAWQGGSPLVVDDVGTGVGLVCLHGLGGGSYFFAGLARALGVSRRVISFDMPGTGFNVDVVESFSIDASVNATIELIDQVSPEPVSLLGHSMGAIAVLKSYALRPDKVNSLIFLGGLPQPIEAIKKKLTDRIEKIARVGMTGIGEEVMPGIFAEKTMSERGQFVCTYQRLLEMNSEESYVQSIQELVEASAEEIVSTVQVPCLAITGEEDLYASPFDMAAFIEKIPSESNLEIVEDCGHMIFYEAPNRFHESVDNFLHSLDSDWEYTYGDDA